MAGRSCNHSNMPRMTSWLPPQYFCSFASMRNSMAGCMAVMACRLMIAGCALRMCKKWGSRDEISADTDTGLVAAVEFIWTYQQNFGKFLHFLAPGLSLEKRVPMCYKPNQNSNHKLNDKPLGVIFIQQKSNTAPQHHRITQSSQCSCCS